MPAGGALASFGLRLAATLIDAVMYFVAALVIGVVVTIAFFGTVVYTFTLSNAVEVGALVMVVLYLGTLLNYLWPLWDKENRPLHDMAASTRVVRA